MCGLHGFITTGTNGFTAAEWEIAYANAWLNQWRGTHSTGLVSVSHKGDYDAIKEIGGLDMLQYSAGWDPFVKTVKAKGKVVYGHGRYATRGKITTANAHPFTVGAADKEIVFIHNGTLNGHQQLPDFKDYDVDSLWLANMIYEYGPQEALAYARGAMALMWYNMGESRFYIYRNDERPLCVAAFGQHTKKIVMNSERASIFWLSERFNLGIKPEEVLQFRPKHLYHMDLFDIAAGWKMEEIKDKNDRWPKSQTVTTYDAGREVRQLPFQPTQMVPRTVTTPPPRLDAVKDDVPRGYTEDILLLLKDQLKQVEFTNRMENSGTRWSTWSDNTLSSSSDVKFYEESLWKLERVNDFVIKKWYNKNGTMWSTEVRFNADELTKVVAKVEKVKEPTTNIDQLSVFKWTTKIADVSIKHKAIPISVRNGTQFYSYYENNVDGKIKKDDVVIVEVKHVDKVEIANLPGTYTCKALCVRVKPEADKCVDFIFQKQKWTKDQLFEIGMFKGKIGFIRPTTDTDEDTGASIICGLTNVEPYEIGSDDAIKV